jgi:asparagine synthase (glutamine-hydrolysing)
MSGIVGIFNRDGAPADRDLLDEMTGYMASQGPDAQQVWRHGAIGFGHTLLRTTWESEREHQPCTLQPCTLDEVWITADARVDGRAELTGKLESAGRRELRQATDPELILHAYEVWGEKCLEHLIGDFAFIIWDGRRRVLFGARDHFGVKPFYYAEAGKTLLCSNTLNCLRLHPGISGELNHLAIADFLVFDTNQDTAATYFRDIQRLPPGHSLVCTAEALRIQRYWTLPFAEVRYKRGEEYVEHFLELFQHAVKDRVRTDKASVYMSGGSDSTLVAAVAHKVSSGSALRADTLVFDRIIRSPERKYSQLAADFIGIPIHYQVLDDYEPYEQSRSWQFSRPEPEHNPLPAVFENRYRQLNGYTRVALTGEGGDPALRTDDGYIAHYLKIGALGDLISGVAWCLRLTRRIPRLGLRSLLKANLGKITPFRLPYPKWLNGDLEKRLQLAQRWEQLTRDEPASGHIRSEVHKRLRSPQLGSYFEVLSPGSTGFGIEHRHPFFDIRVAAYLAALPPLPWCQEKNILKAAGRGILPDEVRMRPKTPLVGDPLREHFRNCGPDWWATHFAPVPELAGYVNPAAISGLRSDDSYELWIDLRLVSINYWLQLGRKPVTSPLKQGLM